MIGREDEPWVDPDELRAANARHDAELGALGIDPYCPVRVRSGWNAQAMAGRGTLTDTKIFKYEQAGYYSAEYKAARKALMDKKNPNFEIRDGRLIYRM